MFNAKNVYRTTREIEKLHERKERLHKQKLDLKIDFIMERVKEHKYNEQLEELKEKEDFVIARLKSLEVKL